MTFRPGTKHFALVSLAILLAGHGFAATKATPWEEEANKDGVDICSRTREGSAIKEFRGVGEIEAPSSAVFAVLSDPEAYPRFMPYVAEVRVLQRTKNCVVTYQRISLPLVSDRDYTLRSVHSKSQETNGPGYVIRWNSANELGPAPKPGVERVLVCEGSWSLEATAPGVTRATYRIYSDTGGAIPAYFANHASRVAIRKVFAAIRKEVQTPKYEGIK